MQHCSFDPHREAQKSSIVALVPIGGPEDAAMQLWSPFGAIRRQRCSFEPHREAQKSSIAALNPTGSPEDAALQL